MLCIQELWHFPVSLHSYRFINDWLIAVDDDEDDDDGDGGGGGDDDDGGYGNAYACKL